MNSAVWCLNLSRRGSLEIFRAALVESSNMRRANLTFCRSSMEGQHAFDVRRGASFAILFCSNL